MTRSHGRVSSMLGLKPGGVVYVGRGRAESVIIWAAEGTHNTTIVEKPLNRFDVHPLVLENAVNTVQRSKLEHSSACEMNSAISADTLILPRPDFECDCTMFCCVAGLIDRRLF